MRFLLLLLPILMFFSFREQSQPAKIRTIKTEDVFAKPFEVYPNPIKDMITLRSNSFKNPGTQLYIFDISGKLVFKLDSINFDENEISKVDVSNLHSGLYFIQLRVNNYSATKKIVKL